VRSADNLRKQFESYRNQSAITRTAMITDAGLTVGAGTLLVRMRKDQFGQPRLALREDRDRALALHCVAFQRRPMADFLRHLARASDHWPHDKALANLRLVFARLPRIACEDDAWCLHLAAALLEDEFAPDQLLHELGFAPFDFCKYDPDQPRVPAGSGRQSGEWGSTGGSPDSPTAAGSRVTPSPTRAASRDSKRGQTNVSAARDVAGIGTRVAESFLDELSAEALEGLTEFAGKVAAPIAFFGAIFIPSSNNGIRSEGTLPGASGVTYSVDHDTGALDLSTVDADDDATAIRAQLRDGIYVDVSTGAPLGRDLEGVLYLDRDAATAALSNTKDQQGETAEAASAPKRDEPKLCPDPGLDNPGATNNANAVKYAQYVSQAIVNPQRQPPLEPGMAFGLLNPSSGQVVIFDDCQDTTGIMQEYKGYYAWSLTNKTLMADRARDFLTQANSQIEANDLRNLQTGMNNPIDWHFKDRATADFAWDLFKEASFLDKIRVFYTPEGRHKSERIWGF
jgi:hypothetical protein